VKHVCLAAALLLAGCASADIAVRDLGIRPDPWGGATNATLAPVTFHNLAVSGESVHQALGDGVIYYRRSIDEGQSWEPWVDLGPGMLFLEDPIAADESVVAIVGVDASDTVVDFFDRRPVGDILLIVSRDNGETWAPAHRLTSGAKVLRVSVAVSGHAIHVAWMDFRSGQWEIRYLRSNDGGETWSREAVAAAGTNAVGAERPSIEARGQVVDLAWMDARDNRPQCRIEGGTVLPVCTAIYYMRSVDGGANWAPARRLTIDQAYSGRPDIVQRGRVLMIVFDRRSPEGHNEVGVLISNNDGETWSASNLGRSDRDQTHARVAASADGFYVIWMESGLGGYRLRYRSSTDGNVWAPEEAVEASAGAGAPALAVTQRYVHAAWASPNLKYARRELRR